MCHSTWFRYCCFEIQVHFFKKKELSEFITINIFPNTIFAANILYFTVIFPCCEVVLYSVSCLILYSFAVHGTFNYFSIFLNNCKLRTILRYLIISVITLNGHQFLPFLHISVVFFIYAYFCIVLIFQQL